MEVRPAVLVFLARTLRRSARRVLQAVPARADPRPQLPGHPRPTAADRRTAARVSRRRFPPPGCRRDWRHQPVGKERRDAGTRPSPRSAGKVRRSKPSIGGTARIGLRDVVETESDSLVTLRIASIGSRPRAAWTEGLAVCFPASVLARTGWRHAIAPNGDLRIPSGPTSISAEDVARLRERRAFTDERPVSARLPFRYHAVPGSIRALVATAIGRGKASRVSRWAAFPGWPIDLSADVLDDLRDDAPAQHPAAAPTPVVITHDIDSPEGLTNLVASFLPLEEVNGARSTSYIVPCAWPIDHARVGEVVARGHEVGVHGFDHGNTTPFAGAEERARRLDAA